MYYPTAIKLTHSVHSAPKSRIRMVRLSISIGTVGLLLACRPGVKGWSGACEFHQHVVEPNIRDGYAVVVQDLNRDGRLDIIGIPARATAEIDDLAWYENPNWERHVILKDVHGSVHGAAHDIDNDGFPELAFASDFDMVAEESKGLVRLLKHEGDPRKPWITVKEIDALPTSHHLAWADIDGDGKKELINGPLIGERAVAPRYEDRVPLVYYRVPPDVSGEWRRRVINGELVGVLHRIRVVNWDGGGREELLTARFNGIVLHRAVGEGDEIHWEHELLSKGHEEGPPRAGTSDVGVGRLGTKRFLAAVEPWHGNEVVVYTQDEAARWQRKVIFDELKEGHEICVADFNGDGRDDLVAGDRAHGERGSSYIFYAQDDLGNQWHQQVLDHLDMSGSGCKVADINGDGRVDPVLIGGGTHNIKWYENMGPSSSR